MTRRGSNPRDEKIKDYDFQKMFTSHNMSLKSGHRRNLPSEMTMMRNNEATGSRGDSSQLGGHELSFNNSQMFQAKNMAKEQDH